MCNPTKHPTKQPPRHDIYQLQEELAADTGGFSLPKNRRIRIGADNEARRVQVYNAEYMSDGTKYASFERPWTVFTPISFRAFKTHAEAITWATQEARK